MPEKDDESPPEAPQFTTDEASSAGTEEPSVAPDRADTDSPEDKIDHDD